MSAQRVIVDLYLAVSAESLVMQALGYYRLRKLKAERWMIRTSACRVVAGAIAVAVGTNAFFDGWYPSPVVLAAYTVTTLMWQTNTRLDIRAHRPKRPRRRRFITISITVHRDPPALSPAPAYDVENTTSEN